MADKDFKTSFIPNKPVQAVSRGGGLGKKSGGSFLTAVTTVIFLAVLVIAAGVYLYGLSLQKQIANQERALAEAQAAFNPAFIAEAVRLNDRIESVKKLLANHKSPSQIFELMEETTLRTVQFTSLSYSTDEEGTIKIEADGAAAGFESVVLQSDGYGATGYLRDILFSGLQNNTTGGVSFDLAGTVDPQLVLFRNSITSGSSNAGMNDTNSGNNNGASDVNSFENPTGTVDDNN